MRQPRRRRHHARRYRQRRRITLLVAGLFIALLLAGVIVLEHPNSRPITHPPRKITPSTRVASTSSTTIPTPKATWQIAWGSAMAWGYGVATDVTIRDLVTVTVGGSAIRIRFTNIYGNAPLKVGEATVGLSAGGSKVIEGTMRFLTFNGMPSVNVPQGQSLYSDPLAMPVQGGETLAITFYVDAPDLVSQHTWSPSTVSYFTPNFGGNITNSYESTGFTLNGNEMRWIDAIDVSPTTNNGAIVVIGDSISDGFHSAVSWTQVLQSRIDSLQLSERRPVINEAITANALLPSTPTFRTDEFDGGGEPGLNRFARDALTQSGVSEVVLFLGTNDLWFGASAHSVIQGYKAAIAMAHAAGVRIIGATLIPRKSSVKEKWTLKDQVNIERVDHWIRTSNAFDGVIDFASVVSDRFNGQCLSTSMFPPYDSGDHLHPNPAGQTAMGNAIDPSVLRLPPMATVPALVDVTNTSNCATTSPG